MPGNKNSEPLSWLAAAWCNQRAKIANLVARLGDLGTVQAMGPSLFGKFMKMLAQVAYEKDKETHIIEEIEAIEKKHQLLRREHKLKKAEYRPAPQQPLPVPTPPDPRSKRGWWWILAFWLLLMKREINQK